MMKTYNDALIIIILCFVNVFPLFLYKDGFKNKIYNYLIIYGIFITNEIIGSIILMFIVSALQLGVLLPQELVASDSLLSFIPVSIMLVIDAIESKYICDFLYFNKKMNMMKNGFLTVISIIILNIQFSMLSLADKSSFILISAVSVFLLLINLYLIYINIDDFIKKYKNFHSLKYYRKMLNEQNIILVNIDDHFKETRKNNHDFINHLVIINTLLETNDTKAINYIYDLIKTFRRR